jgi:hypothetical protein
MLLRLRLNPEHENATDLPYLFIHVLAIAASSIHEVSSKPSDDLGCDILREFEVINHYVCLTNVGIRHILDIELEFAIESGHYLIDEG